MEFFSLDALSILMLGTLAVVSVPVFLHSLDYFRDNDHADRSAKGLYYGALVVLVLALAAGYLANHIVVTWIFTEITTLASGFLIYHHRNSLSLEAVWKYVFVCAISVTFIFIGILLWSLALIECNVTDLHYTTIRDYAAVMNPLWLTLGFVFIFTGYTVKMGLFPMFTAGIDAKDNAPAPSAAMLSSVLLNLGFVGIYRSFVIMSASSYAGWARVILIATAMITLFISTVYMVKITNIKRMWAYSSIEHSSVVCIGLALGEVGAYWAIMHLIMHSLVKAGLFLHITQLYRVYKSKNISDMGNYININPFGAVVLLLGVFSVTAVPPSGLFMSELGVFACLIGSGHWVLFTLMVLFLTVLIWAILKSALRLVFLPCTHELEPVKIGWWESLSGLVLFVLAMYIGYAQPAFLTELIHNAASMIL